MEFKNLQLEDVIVLEDKKRKPLSTMDRSKRKGIYPYYGAQEIIDSIDDYIFDGKYILLAEDGENLKSRKKDLVKIVEGKFWLNNHAHIFKVKENVDLEYLYYYLLKLDLGEYITGSTQPKLNQENMNKIKIKLPELKIQRKISKILSNIDKKIKLNNEINNNLYELEKALYKKYFKDLPADNTKKLGELCNIKYGKGLPTKKIEKEGYPVYGGNGIIGYYHEFMYDDSQVLISCRGAASGNVIVSKPKSFVTNNSLILESDRKYHHYLKQYSLDNYYYEYTTGSAQPQITIDNIKDIVLIIPSDELLEAFNKQMDSLELKAFANLEELEKLKKLRDTLLPQLMNGEIDLDNIEI